MSLKISVENKPFYYKSNSIKEVNSRNRKHGQKPPQQNREPGTNSTHMWYQLQVLESNPVTVVGEMLLTLLSLSSL